MVTLNSKWWSFEYLVVKFDQKSVLSTSEKYIKYYYSRASYMLLKMGSFFKNSQILRQVTTFSIFWLDSHKTEEHWNKVLSDKFCKTLNHGKKLVINIPYSSSFKTEGYLKITFLDLFL